MTLDKSLDLFGPLWVYSLEMKHIILLINWTYENTESSPLTVSIIGENEIKMITSLFFHNFFFLRWGEGVLFLFKISVFNFSLMKSQGKYADRADMSLWCGSSWWCWHSVLDKFAHFIWAGSYKIKEARPSCYQAQSWTHTESERLRHQVPSARQNHVSIHLIS